MSLIEKIDLDLTEAMKTGDQFGVTALRMLKSSIKNAEIAKRGELNEEEIVAVLEREAKQRKEAMDEFRVHGREELANKEEAELELIGRYLPEKMSEDEVREAVRNILSVGSFTDFGQAMGAAMGELKGKADGSLVSRIVKEVLESK